MLLKGMVRLGRALEQGGLPPDELLVQLGDGAGTAAAHYGRVWLAEARMEAPGRWRTAVLPYAEWAVPDSGGRAWHAMRERVAAAPVVLVVGGKLTLAQGRYPVPVYPMWPDQQLEMARDPREVVGFLRSRLQRTFGWDERRWAGLEEAVAGELAAAMAGPDPAKGLMVLLVDGLSPAYRLRPQDPRQSLESRHVILAASKLAPGMDWVADLTEVLGQFWWAKWGEGAEYGMREDGVCSLCGRSGPVVSFYAKAWPWFSVSWEAPLPQELPHDRLDEGVGLCQACYRHLTLGGNAFESLKRPMPARLSAEVFRPGSAQLSGGVRSNVPRIVGVAYVLPVLDHAWQDPEEAARVARALQRVAERAEHGAGRHLTDIVGLQDTFLPDDLTNDAFRLYLVYFSEQQAEAKFHALVEDVLPSIVGRLQDAVLPRVQEMAAELQLRVGPVFLLWLLAKAFGPRFVWQSLARVLRAQDLDTVALVARAARELAAAARLLTVDGNALPLWRRAREYLLTRRFLQLYREVFAEEIRRDGGVEEAMGMTRDWRALQALADGDPSQPPASDPEELGFVAGHLVARFGRQYFRRTGGKDYLKTRVLPFGSALTPTLVRDRAVGKIQELAAKLDIPLARVLVHQTGKWLNEYTRMEEEVIRHKEAFLAGFWSGYALYDLAPSARKDSEEASVYRETREEEEEAEEPSVAESGEE